MRWPKTLLALIVGGTMVFAPRPAVTEAQVGSCTYTLGFRTLHDMIPNTVGDCIENEWHNPYNGDGLQRTTRGMMVWRKIDNWTAFTDGYMTWINGPFGLQSRLNTERFAWEPVAPIPAPPDLGSGGGTAGGGGTSGGGSTGGGTSGGGTADENQAPTISIRLSESDVVTGQEFTVRLEASDEDGIEAIWWWATDTDDTELRNTHIFECHGATPCRATWTVSTLDTGEIRFRAASRDRNGRTSDEESREVDVRRAPTPTPTATPTATPTPTVSAAVKP